MTFESEGAAPPARPRLVAGIVAVAFFMQMLDATVIATSLPAMAAHFGTSVVDLNIGFTAYLLAMAIGIPPAGWLAERYGARRVFLAAIALFSLASAACALAESLPAFAAARMVQGIGGALMTPVGRQIVLANTPRHRLLQAIALITWPALIAPIAGPILGGWITLHVGWQWNFLINLPLGALGLVLSLAFIRDRGTRAPRPFDMVGFLLSAAAMSLLLIGLEQVAQARPVCGLALLAAGGLAAWLSIRHLRRARHPLIDLAVTSIPTFALSSLGAGTFARMAINATPFLLPLILQVGLGLDPLAAGSFVMAYFLGNLAMKPATSWTLARIGFRRLLIATGLMASASLLAMALVDSRTPPLALTLILFAAGLVRSMQFTALNTIAFADVDGAARGPATTLSAMSQQGAQLMAIAVSALVIRMVDLAGLAGVDEAGRLLPYRVAFCVMALIAAATALRFRALPADAAAALLQPPPAPSRP